MNSLMRRRLAAGLLTALLVVIPAALFAHAVVYPKSSTSGAFERYVLRIPNEKEVPTTRVEIHFPPEVRVLAFADVPGWQLQVLTDSTKAITGAVWTGTLGTARFVEFPFEAKNPKTAARLAWPTYQTYSTGERVEWTGDEHTKTPASITVIRSPSVVADLGLSPWVSIFALLLALVSTGLAMRGRVPAPVREPA
jgi:uncharacterized protein YcnI